MPQTETNIYVSDRSKSNVASYVYFFFFFCFCFRTIGARSISHDRSARCFVINGDKVEFIILRYCVTVILRFA